MLETKERPILFSAPMVRALLDGRKTVTRRACKPQPSVSAHTTSADGSPMTSWWETGKDIVRCPYGQPGDRLWVRETFALLGNEDGVCVDWADNVIKGDEQDAARIYRASCPPGDYGLAQIPAKAEWKPDTEAMEYDGAWRPSIHMPRWASRILLEVTGVRVERLQDISGEQALAEGIYSNPDANGMYTPDGDYHTSKQDGPVRAFAALWEKINGDNAWNANPWVWVVKFKRATP